MRTMTSQHSGTVQAGKGESDLGLLHTATNDENPESSSDLI